MLYLEYIPTPGLIALIVVVAIGICAEIYIIARDANHRNMPRRH